MLPAVEPSLSMLHSISEQQRVDVAPVYRLCFLLIDTCSQNHNINICSCSRELCLELCGAAAARSLAP